MNCIQSVTYSALITYVKWFISNFDSRKLHLIKGRLKEDVGIICKRSNIIGPVWYNPVLWFILENFAGGLWKMISWYIFMHLYPAIITHGHLPDISFIQRHKTNKAHQNRVHILCNILYRSPHNMRPIKSRYYPPQRRCTKAFSTGMYVTCGSD